jgi:hypothetical protein
VRAADRVSSGSRNRHAAGFLFDRLSYAQKTFVPCPNIRDQEPPRIGRFCLLNSYAPQNASTAVCSA